MGCINYISPICELNNGVQNDILDSIKYLPDSIRKEIRLLCKQYYILSIEQCGNNQTFDEFGERHSIFNDLYGEKIFIQKQKYDVKIEYINIETRQKFFKVLLSYKN